MLFAFLVSKHCDLLIERAVKCEPFITQKLEEVAEKTSSSPFVFLHYSLFFHPFLLSL